MLVHWVHKSYFDSNVILPNWLGMLLHIKRWEKSFNQKETEGIKGKQINKSFCEWRTVFLLGLLLCIPTRLPSVIYHCAYVKRERELDTQRRLLLQCATIVGRKFHVHFHLSNTALSKDVSKVGFKLTYYFIIYYLQLVI